MFSDLIMSLINCKECENVVSSEAETCPKCGVKIASKQMGCVTKTTIFVIGVIFIGAMSRISTNDSTDSEKKIPSTAQVLADLDSENDQLKEKLRILKADSAAATDKKNKDEAVRKSIIGAIMLKKSMRDPDSFKLESAYVIEKTGAVCYEYRAKNGFGGTNVGRAVFSGEGKGFKTSEMQGFTRRWNKECVGKSGSETSAYINWYAL